MSIVGKYNETTRSIEPLSIRIKEQMGEKADPVSGYNPSDEEKQVRDMVLKHFTLGYLNMYTPRQEFNDLAVIQRAMVDQMAFNTYQSNNGQPYEGDSQGWHSRALRPIVRNQCIVSPPMRPRASSSLTLLPTTNRAKSKKRRRK